MDTPVVIEVALNGVTTRKRNPNVPAADDDLAKDALACIDAGATVIHTHAPHLVVDASEAAAQYAAAFQPAVEQHPGVICYPTVGFGDTMEDRYRHVELLHDMKRLTSSRITARPRSESKKRSTNSPRVRKCSSAMPSIAPPPGV